MYNKIPLFLLLSSPLDDALRSFVLILELGFLGMFNPFLSGQFVVISFFVCVFGMCSNWIEWTEQWQRMSILSRISIEPSCAIDSSNSLSRTTSSSLTIPKLYFTRHASAFKQDNLVLWFLPFFARKYRKQKFQIVFKFNKHFHSIWRLVACSFGGNCPGPHGKYGPKNSSTIEFTSFQMAVWIQFSTNFVTI